MKSPLVRSNRLTFNELQKKWTYNPERSREICGCLSAFVHEEQPDSPSRDTATMNANIAQHPHHHHTVIPSILTRAMRVTKEMNCHPERKGPQAHFSLGVVSRRICICFSGLFMRSSPTRLASYIHTEQHLRE